MTKSSLQIELNAKRIALIKALIKDNPGIELTSIRAKMMLWDKYALDVRVDDCAMALQELAQEGLAHVNMLSESGPIIKCSYVVKG